MTRSTSSRSLRRGHHGVLRVTETIVWRFGDDSGRHGIDRFIVTREPYDDEQDAVYTVTTSTSPARTPVCPPSQREHRRDHDGREEHLRLRIGDPDETISADTATYVISYDRRPARCAPSPATTSSSGTRPASTNPMIEQLTIKATVPGGAQDAQLLRRPARQQGRPARPTSSPTAVPPSSPRATSRPVRACPIGVKIKPGLIADNKRRTSSRTARKMSPGARRSRRSPRRGRGRADRRSARRSSACSGGARTAGTSGTPASRPGPRRCPARQSHVVPERPRPSDPGRVLPTADPGRRGRSADRRAGGHPGDRGDHHRPRRTRRADRAERGQGRLPGDPGRP